MSTETLISAAYYDRPIESLTVDDDGKPLARVVHPFTAPAAIAKCQLVWIDVGWPGTSVEKPGQTRGREASETSAIEADAIRRFLRVLRVRPEFTGGQRVAVLSPYRRQVLKLSNSLQDIYANPPVWLSPLKTGEFPASTVDSFQGNQADVVIVSLVRRNGMASGEGLGFLREAARMNVLFSRAERILVLVGSWDFFKYQVRLAS